MASDTVPNESVDHRDVLAHQKFASFLSSQASHESANVVNLSVSEAKNFFRIFVFVLINSKDGVLLGNFGLDSREISFVVDFNTDIRLGHASSFESSDGQVPSPVVMPFVKMTSIIFSIGSFLFSVDRTHVVNLN